MIRASDRSRGRAPAAIAAICAASLAMASCSTRHPSGAAPTPRSATTTATTTTATEPVAIVPKTGDAWTTYMGGNARLGDAAAQPALPPLRLAWSAPLDSTSVFGQPLVAFGRIFAATEGDNVFALDPRDGHVLWQTSIGSPLRDVATQAGCGNIDPLGITSTPVVDTASHTVYVVGEVSTDGQRPVHHELVAIDALTGRTLRSVSVDPPLPAGEDPVNLLQRAALALANGRVYVGYGGNYGDCGRYHGWVVGVPTVAGQPIDAFDTTPASTGGAVWQSGGGPSVDPTGNLFITTGNPNSAGPAPWAEAVVKLSATLPPSPEASFQDTSATGDADLGTGEATLLPDGTVFAVGKTDRGFLLRQSDLTELAPVTGRICGSDPDGGAAFDAKTDSLYVPCRDGGLQQVDLARRRTGWHAGSANATPILAGGGLWALRYPSGNLQEMDPVSGRTIQTIALGVTVPNFATPAIASGLVVVGTTAGVVAVSGSAH